jgi:hypothetical protein
LSRRGQLDFAPALEHQTQVGGREVVEGDCIANARDHAVNFIAAELFCFEFERFDLFDDLGVCLGHGFQMKE